jgi:hypothetical protein
VAGRIRSFENSSDLIGNQTHDFPADWVGVIVLDLYRKELSSNLGQYMGYFDRSFVVFVSPSFQEDARIVSDSTMTTSF